MRVFFTIPGKPEGKRRPRTRVIFNDGRHTATIYSDPADKAREVLIRTLARAAMAGRPAFDGPVRVTIGAVFEPAASWPKARIAEALAGGYHTVKPDGDNVLKSVLDGLNPEPGQKPFCLRDDAQAAEQLIRKNYGPSAHTLVVIDALAPEGGLASDGVGALL